MTRPRTLLAAAALLAAATAAPSYAAGTTPVAANGPCTAPAGAIVLTPGGTTYSGTVPTPVGALNDFVVDASEDAGKVYVDLAGLPSTTKATVTLTLSWDNPVSDYDLVVNGVNDLSSDNPEVKEATVGHCRPVALRTDVFLGVPVDTLTLTAAAAV